MSNETCKCQDWCDASYHDRKIRILTGHHPTCRCVGEPLDAAFDLISRLVVGIEAWAADEDGVHDEVWEAYRQAKALDGVYLPNCQSEQQKDVCKPEEKSSGPYICNTCGKEIRVKYGDSLEESKRLYSIGWCVDERDIGTGWMCPECRSKERSTTEVNDLFFIKYWDETGLISIMKSESTGEYWAKLNDGSGTCSFYGPYKTTELMEIDMSKSNILDAYTKKPVLDLINSYRVYPNPTSELDDHWFNCKCGNMQRIRAQSSGIAKDKVKKRGWTWTKIECEQQKEIWRCSVCSGNLKDDDDTKINSSTVDDSNQVKSKSNETKIASEDVTKYLWCAIPSDELKMRPNFIPNTYRPGGLVACSTKDYEELRKGTYVVKNCAFCGGTGIGPNDLPNGMVWICGTCAEMREDVKNTILKRTEKLDGGRCDMNKNQKTKQHQNNRITLETRINELRKVKDGWCQGGGVAPPCKDIDWILNHFSHAYPEELPTPYFYPTPDGGIQVEWSIGDFEASLVINFERKIGCWHMLHMERNDEDYSKYNLDSLDDWSHIYDKIRKMMKE